jgi:CRP-like cAMP-binding protein
LSPNPTNRILKALSASDRQLLEPALVLVNLQVHDELEEPGVDIEKVYFPESGIVSVVAMQGDEQKAEIGIVGCEGVTGSAVILGGVSSPHETYIQVAGDGYVISSAALRDAMSRSASVSTLLLKYVQAFLVQVAHTAIANADARLAERLARWLLMAHDRVKGDELRLTHEFLALMLAVRRSGVTEAIAILEGEGMIKGQRGLIIVRNRDALVKRAGPYYGVPEAEYARLFGDSFARTPA